MNAKGNGSGWAVINHVRPSGSYIDGGGFRAGWQLQYIVTFSLAERRTVPLVTSTFVPSRSTAFTSVRSKSVSLQNPPSIVMQTQEVGLYPQFYTPNRSQSQPQLLQKPELRLQSPTRSPTPPKLVSSTTWGCNWRIAGRPTL